jgi:hypothetical protein
MQFVSGNVSFMISAYTLCSVSFLFYASIDLMLLLLYFSFIFSFVYMFLSIFVCFVNCVDSPLVQCVRKVAVHLGYGTLQCVGRVAQSV